MASRIIEVTEIVERKYLLTVEDSLMEDTDTLGDFSEMLERVAKESDDTLCFASDLIELGLPCSVTNNGLKQTDVCIIDIN